MTKNDKICEDDFVEECQQYFELADFVEDHLEDFDTTEVKEIENPEESCQIGLEIPIEEFPDFQLLEPIENPSEYNIPKGTEIFMITKPFSKKSDSIQVKSVEPLKSIKSEKPRKVLSFQKKDKKKKENFLKKLELNNIFEKKNYVFNVAGAKLTLSKKNSDIMNFFSKGNLQGMTTYVLKRLSCQKQVKKDFGKKIVNAVKKFVETLVPKKYFSRKLTLTKMTQQLMKGAHFSQKRRFRKRREYLKILKTLIRSPQFDQPKTKKVFQCGYCKHISGRKTHLNIHIKSVHLKLKPFQCTQCDKMFGTTSDLNKHIKGIHEKAYVCQACGHISKSQNMLNSHIKSVHEKAFVCTNCNKNFSAKADLKRHKESVHEKKRYKCTSCDSTFSSKGNLSGHIKEKHQK